MLALLKNWSGAIEVNGEHYDSVSAFISSNKSLSGQLDIKLYSPVKKAAPEAGDNHIQEAEKAVEYKITVKQYMTKKADARFDFMAKWNNDNPMPLRTMTGKVIKETKGMVYMKLRGQAEATCKCLRCGRGLTNPVSRHYGIGPECMEKLGMIRMDIEDIAGISQKLTEVEWEGWVIRSAILKEEEIK